jgi:hypothetical protein
MSDFMSSVVCAAGKRSNISLQIIRIKKNQNELAAGIFYPIRKKMKISGSKKTPRTY